MIVLLTLMNVFFILFALYRIDKESSKFWISFWAIVVAIHFTDIVIRTIKYWNI